jgi:hypothetical protein
MAEDSKGKDNGIMRELLALVVTCVSLGGVIALAIMILRVTSSFPERQQLLGTVLPLIGTWVGTVLAFYFTKENFEAAARSVSDMAKQIPAQQKLQAISARTKMIPRDQMFFKTAPIDNLKIVDLLKELEDKGKGDRVPVLTDKNIAKYIIHRSLLDRYLADKARTASTPGAPAAPGTGAAAAPTSGTLTMGDLFKEKPELEKLFATSFGVIKQDGTLADAQSAMQRTKNCEDVFVTSGGTANDEVLGWITDNIIQDNLQA